jgi:hypothetical protein
MVQGTPALARAQVFLEITGGFAAGHASVAHFGSRGLGGDILLGLHPGAARSGGLVTAIGVSGQARMMDGACGVAPGGSCPISFPNAAMFSMQAGWETPAAGARVLVGPALVTANSRDVGAVIARADLARLLFGRLSALATVRYAYIPRLDGAAFGLVTLGVGVRVR